MTLINLSAFTFGNIEPPVIPGFEIKPMRDSWVMATGRRKTWFVGRTKTHWLLTQAGYGQIAPAGREANKDWKRLTVAREDVARIAFPICPKCGSYGYRKDEESKRPEGWEPELIACDCESGAELVRIYARQVQKTFCGEKVTGPQVKTLLDIKAVSTHAARTRRMFVTAMSFERLREENAQSTPVFPATGNDNPKE